MMRAICVDDEPKALEIIQRHCEKIPFLQLTGSFRNALDALDSLGRDPVELVFLDINMPQLSGLKFREMAGEQVMIIFTTAYSEYAVESYEMNAVDYLVKPVAFERFLKAVIKARDLFRLKRGEPALAAEEKRDPEPAAPGNRIYVKSGTKLYTLRTEDIIFLEKDGNYITFHTTDQRVVARLNIAQALALLPGGEFVQTHKSYIVARRHIKVVEAHQVTLTGGHTAPVGRVFRDGVV